MYPHGPLLPAASLAAGIAIGFLIGAPWWAGIFPVAFALIAYGSILYGSGSPMAALRLNKLHAVWIILLFLGIGIADEALSRPRRLSEMYGNFPPDMVACEVKSVLTRAHGDRIEAGIEGSGGALVRIGTDASRLSPGDMIMIPFDSFKPIESDTSAFARKIAPVLEARGILYSAVIPAQDIPPVGKKSYPYAFFCRLRDDMSISVERSHIDRATAGFINAVLLGSREGLDENARLTFAGGGMAHMLALSGMHLAIIAGLLLLLTWPLKLAGRYKWGYGAAVVLIWLYVLLTGCPISSVRAAIMVSFAFMAVILERKNSAKSALWSACLIILLVDPRNLFEAGFQLSVACVAALLYFSPHLNPIGHRQHPALYKVCEALLATITATVASWPLTSYYFGQIPMMFLPLNVVILPLFPAVLAAALVFTLFLCMGVEISFLGHCLEAAYGFMVDFIEFLSGGEESVLAYRISGWEVMAWCLLLTAAAWLLNKKEPA